MHYWASYVNGHPTYCFELNQPADLTLIERDGPSQKLLGWLAQNRFSLDNLIIAVRPRPPVIATNDDALALAFNRAFGKGVSGA